MEPTSYVITSGRFIDFDFILVYIIWKFWLISSMLFYQMSMDVFKHKFKCSDVPIYIIMFHSTLSCSNQPYANEDTVPHQLAFMFQSTCPILGGLFLRNHKYLTAKDRAYVWRMVYLAVSMNCGVELIVISLYYMTFNLIWFLSTILGWPGPGWCGSAISKKANSFFLKVFNVIFFAFSLS